MKPFKFLLTYCLGFIHKFNLACLKLGTRQVIRIDVFTGNTNPFTLKLALKNAGFHYCELKTTPGNPKHIAGLAVSKSLALAKEYQLANEQGDTETMLRLSGPEFVFPMKKKDFNINGFQNIAPNVFLEMNDLGLLVA